MMALHNPCQLFHFVCGTAFIQAIILHFAISHFAQQAVYFPVNGSPSVFIFSARVLRLSLCVYCYVFIFTLSERYGADW